MGRGHSKSGSSGTAKPKKTTAAPQPDFPEAFASGVDFKASGDVDHSARTVSWQLQRQWDNFTAPYDVGVTNTDWDNMMKDYDWQTDSLYGYVRTSNSFAINQALYDPANAGKTDAQIFTRTDRRGVKRDLKTVQTMDNAIAAHQTQADASYTRFSSPAAIQSTFGLSDSQMAILSSARSMNAGELATLNSVMSGKSSYSKAYTSTSANRSMNAFGNPNARQSRGFIFERRLNVPKGTNAFAVSRNAQESEVIFGRNMKTQLTHISIGSDGHIILHEQFAGY